MNDDETSAHIFLTSKLIYILSSANPLLILLKLAQERLYLHQTLNEIVMELKIKWIPVADFPLQH